MRPSPWVSLADVARDPATWLGFTGSLCVLLGSLSPAYLPQASPVWEVLFSLSLAGPIVTWAGTILTLLGLFLLTECWLRLRPARRAKLGRPQLRHWAVLAIVAAPLMIGPPVFSHDAYSYAAQGWLLHNGVDPYDVGPGVLPGQFADQVSWEWRETPAPYGPLALRISQWLLALGGFDPIAGTLLQRVPALLGVLLIGLTVPRIAARAGIAPSAASWFALVNPILIIDFIGGMHNDSLMVGLMLSGVWLTYWLAERWRKAARWQRGVAWLMGAAVIGVAASIKQPAFLAAAALPFLVQTVPKWRLRTLAWGAARSLASVAVAVGVFAVVSIATGLNFGWLNAVHVPALVDTVSPSTVLGHIVQLPVNWLGWDTTGRVAVVTMRTVGWVVFALGTCVLAWRYLGSQPLRFTSWAYVLFGLSAPALHSWYMMWGGVLFPMSRPRQQWLRAAIVITVVLLGYAAVNFSLRNGLGLMALLLVVAAYWSVHSHELTQQWEAEPLSTQPA